MNTNTSLWLSDIVLPPPEPWLRGDVKADVVIIGAGLAGTLSAYLLSRAGKKVVVLEKKDTGNSITAYTTAWLNCVIDTDLHDLAHMYSPESARKIWASGMDAITLIEKIIEEENIECDFMRVSHFRFARDESELKNLEKEHKSAQTLGFETFLHGKEALSFPNQGSLEIKNQAKFHPLKFLLGLRSASARSGAVYYENSEVEKIEDDMPVIVTTKSGKVTATHCIIATYEPFNKPRELSAYEGMYISYVLEAHMPKGLIPEGLYEDEKNPYHYFRVDAEENTIRIILGGEDHRKEIPIPAEKNFHALESYLAKLFPDIQSTITRKWSGGILETIDGLPYIGVYSEKFKNRLVATGFSGNGMTYSAISARIFADIILQKSNPYIRIYSASRKTRPYNFLMKMRDFTSEFFGGFVKNIFK